jgi:hypothetical protein
MVRMCLDVPSGERIGNFCMGRIIVVDLMTFARMIWEKNNVMKCKVADLEWCIRMYVRAVFEFVMSLPLAPDISQRDEQRKSEIGPVFRFGIFFSCCGLPTGAFTAWKLASATNGPHPTLILLLRDSTSFL